MMSVATTGANASATLPQLPADVDGIHAEELEEVQDVQKTPLSMDITVDNKLKVSKRGLFRNGGTVPSAICLTKAAIGAGVLSISAHAAEVGFAYTLACLVIGGVLTVIGIAMIAEASIATSCWSFEDICEDLFHPAMAVWTGFINVCNCLGAASGYLIVCGQIFAVLTDADEQARRIFVTLVGVFVCCPLALAPHVGFMRHLAAVSVAAICLLVIVVVVYLADNGINDSVTQETFLLGRPSEGGMTAVFRYLNTVNIVVFAYNNQFNVPQLTSELTPQPSTRRMKFVASISSSICFTMYLAVSLFGILAFGVEDEQKDTLILDLYPHRRSQLVIVAFCAVGFSVLTCFQFHIYPIRQFLAYVTRRLRGRSAKDDAPDPIYWGHSLTRWLDIVCALLSVAVAIFIAVVVTELRTILDFIGAFAGAWVSYVIPPMFLIQIRRKGNGFSWFRFDILAYIVFCAFGLFLFIFGTYAAVVG